MSHPSPPSLWDRLSTAALRVLPQHLLAAGMYRVARVRAPWFKDLLIRQVSRRYGVDMAEARRPDPDAYASFNDFFTRALRDDARPIDDAAIVSPADGCISQIGAIDGDALLQAKGHTYGLQALLGGDGGHAAAYRDGHFATIYLSPRDYHRVHMPFAGTLEAMTFVPGELFSVSDATTQLVPGLFARNERVVCHFRTQLGPMAVILVGAIFVGSMETVWHGEVRGDRGQPTRWAYPRDREQVFATGDEIGRFNMGSTVILLLPPGAVSWRPDRVAGSAVRMGEALGSPASAT